ncbi:MAG: hypothetical protein WBD50_02385 [Candidatus Rhabdochlamydia sp.]
MNEETYSLVEELTNEYIVKELSNSEIEIYIRIPKKYEFLWLVKLSELCTTEKEIAEYKE